LGILKYVLVFNFGELKNFEILKKIKKKNKKKFAKLNSKFNKMGISKRKLEKTKLKCITRF